jgi:hypothetical protein
VESLVAYQVLLVALLAACQVPLVESLVESLVAYQVPLAE